MQSDLPSLSGSHGVTASGRHGTCDKWCLHEHESVLASKSQGSNYPGLFIVNEQMCGSHTRTMYFNLCISILFISLRKNTMRPVKLCCLLVRRALFSYRRCPLFRRRISTKSDIWLQEIHSPSTPWITIVSLFREQSTEEAHFAFLYCINLA